MDDRHFMKMALDLAAGGRGYTSPNPMVGAVVVLNGVVVGKGFHRRLGEAHAEVNAIDDAGQRAAGATLYVTLEPCHHTGKTLPCTEKIIDAGISRVVMAMEDPNPHVRGGGAAYLRHRGIAVTVGVLRAKARALNEFFVKHVTTGRPFVIAKCAATLDGRIATSSGDSRWVTGASARQFVHEVRHAVDAIMVGVGTVIQDDPRLTARMPDVAAVDPVRVVLDTRLRIPETAQVLRLESDSDTIIVSAEDVPADRRLRIERPGVRVLTTPLRDGRIDLDALMTRLGAEGIASVLIEGGSRVLASAFAAGVVDKVHFFYAPKILGGDGFPICRGPGPEKMADAIDIRDVRIHRLGQDILVEGYVAGAEVG